MTTKVYRVIPTDKARDIHVGDIVPIPQEDNSFKYSDTKTQVEDIFERVRAKLRSDLPSRKACLFVFPFDKEIIENWLYSAHSHEDFSYVLLTLELHGTLIWCEMNRFTDTGTPLGTSVKEALAREYWESASTDYSKFETPEGLFVGRAVVVNIKQKHHNGK